LQEQAGLRTISYFTETQHQKRRVSKAASFKRRNGSSMDMIWVAPELKRGALGILNWIKASGNCRVIAFKSY